jgi:hypothetical protein
VLLSDALDILADRLDTIAGLTVSTDPAVTIVVPMAVVSDVELDYNESMRRGAALLTFAVTVYVSQADSSEGLYEARRYLSGHGDLSIRDALETQPDAGDLLLNKVSVDTGERSESDNYIIATFTGRAHIPGEVAT